MVNNAFKFTATSPVTFSDVSADAWYAPHVARAQAAGYITGYPDGTIRPGNNITRQEAAAIIFNLKKLVADEMVIANFADASLFPAWSKGPVGAVVKAGFMKGYPDNTFKPAGLITRAESVIVVQNSQADQSAQPVMINIAAIPGVTAPATGSTPVAAITATAQYTGTVSWSPAATSFSGGTVYTATITLTPKPGFTLMGVPANFFTVAGATATNAAGSGVVTAVFPATQVAFFGGGGVIITPPAPVNLDQPAPTGLEGVATTYYGDSDGKITGTTTAMQYKLISATTWSTAFNTETTGLSAGIYQVRFAAKSGYNAGSVTEIEISNGPNRDQGIPVESLQGWAPSSKSSINGMISGTTIDMEYKLSTLEQWLPALAVGTTGLAAGNYDVRYAAKTGYNAGNSVVVSVPQAVAKLLFTFDDGWIDTRTVAYDILNSKGIKGTVYVCRDSVIGTSPLIMRESDLAILYDAGWDLSNHSINHKDFERHLNGIDPILYPIGDPNAQFVEFSSKTDEATLNELKDLYNINQQWMIDKGWTRGANHAAYPSGLWSRQMIETIKSIGVLTGRLADYSNISNNSPTFSPVDLFQIPVQYVETDWDDRNYNREAVKLAITKAVNNGESLMLMIHRVADEKDNEHDLIVIKSDLEAIISHALGYVSSVELNIMTISEWYNSIPDYPVTEIILNETSISIPIGAKEWLFATILPDNKNRVVTWSSSDETVAKVDSLGRVEAIGLGNAIITATVASGISTICNVSVVEPLEITAYKPIPDVNILTNDGFTIETIIDVLKKAMSDMVTLLAGDKEVEVPVTWEIDSTPPYNNAHQGTYLLTGTIGTLPAGYIDEESKILTVTVKIIINGVNINIASIEGVAPPVTGSVPVTKITETQQYTGTVTWSPADSTFQSNTVYTATINLMPKPGFTLIEVADDFFKVTGATSVTYVSGSDTITALFPTTVPTP
jgi:hypothetical protein